VEIADLELDAVEVDESVTAEDPGTSVEKAPLNAKESLLAQIGDAGDVFALHAIEEAYRANEEEDKKILSAMMTRRDKLVAKNERQPMIDGYLDLVAFDFNWVEDKDYQLRWYFIVTDDITLDWRLKAILKVDESHFLRLPAKHQKAGTFSEVIRANESGIGSWKKGQHKVMSLTLSLEQIPHSIVSRFYQYFPDKPQIYSNKAIDHGWYIDIAE
jgi:hypothetical protein